MKYTGNRRITKAVREIARERRTAMFDGMTVEEITNELPIAKAYLYEFESPTKYGEKVGIFVPDCPICGATHLHGARNAPEGIRSPICLITNEPIPNNYQLQIDWSDQDNVRLAKKYNIEMKSEPHG